MATIENGRDVLTLINVFTVKPEHREEFLMVTSTLRAQDETFRRYWPFAAGGLVSPGLAIGLTQWMPLHFAAGIAMFTIFGIAHWVFLRTSFRARQDGQPGMGTSLMAGLAGGLVTGVITYLVPWK